MTMTARATTGKAVDELMERASDALVATDYFETDRLALRAMIKARAVNDFERMARICLPLQESRRQRRHQAVDSGASFLIDDLPRRGGTLDVGCYLLEPPLVGIDARTVREMAERKRVPVLVLVREPTTMTGKWPVVGVGAGDRNPVVVRAQVEPPRGFTASTNGHTGPRAGPDVAWFLASQEVLGDAAILKVHKNWPADHRVDDLLELIEAVPDHEKLLQALESTCREAAKLPLSDRPRRRPLVDDPFSF